ncbi:MAG: phosphomannomutase [bacterium]
MNDKPARPACFKAYDIRGRIPDELNEDLAYQIGLATVQSIGTGEFVVGRDCRLSSGYLSAALMRGLSDGGASVLDIGLCGTEQVYFTTFARKLGGGIMVTASHNPADYNGMKLVRSESRPISGDSGLDEIGALVLQGLTKPDVPAGQIRSDDTLPEFIEFLLAQVTAEQLRPLKIVVNPGNGCAGPVIDALADSLPCEFIRLHHEPDGTFPHGIPNPLLPENRSATTDAVREHSADLGLAWDGDFDRCFFFDERGEFIEGYYLVGLLASAVLRSNPGAKIVHDPRLTWNTIDIVTKAGGTPIQNKTGHAFIKERMRREDAAYGGEMSAHHYFRDFAYCDSGMIPWLLVWQEMTVTGQPLSALVKEMQTTYPVSGEINRRLADPDSAIASIKERFAAEAIGEDHTDGLSLEMQEWRLNLRKSNTEPVVRLNVESRGNRELMQEKTAEILAILDS